MIDMHFHVLPGIDDGPQTMDESLALARAAAAAGVSTLVATPHVSWRCRNDAGTIARLVGELGARLAEGGVRLELRAGAEVAMSYLPEIAPDELSRLALGDGRWLLVEPPFTPGGFAVEAIVEDLRRRGHLVLIAHPERCPAFLHDPKLLGRLVRGGALASITAGSLVGRFGSTPQRFARRLLDEELVHNVASDAHDLGSRAPGIAEELEQAGATPLAQWLTEEVPAAILHGGEIPARPRVALAHRRRRWPLAR